MLSKNRLSKRISPVLWVEHVWICARGKKHVHYVKMTTFGRHEKRKLTAFRGSVQVNVSAGFDE
jgi:hypothetical protein